MGKVLNLRVFWELETAPLAEHANPFVFKGTKSSDLTGNI